MPGVNRESESDGTPSIVRPVRRARLLGALQIVVGLVVFGINVALRASKGQYVPALFIIGAPVLAVGIWNIATSFTGAVPVEKPPRWWKIGFYASLAVGVLVGLYLGIHLRS